MSRIRAMSTALALWTAVVAFEPSVGPLERARYTVEMLRAHKFDQVAAELYEPPSKTPELMAADRAGIAKMLAALTEEVGDFDGQLTHHPERIGPFTAFGISGGDRPRSPDDVGADDAQEVAFDGRFSKFGEVQLGFTYAHVGGQWEVLSIAIRIPTTGPDAQSRMAALFAKMTSRITQDKR